MRLDSLAASTVSKAQRARLPPGLSMDSRSRDPARKRWANGKMSTETSTNSPSGSGSAAASVCRGTGWIGVDCSSSSARWLARSQPVWT